MRSWIILRRIDYPSGSRWQQTTAVQAWSAASAIKIATSGEDNPYPTGDYIAVPMRWWKIRGVV